MIRTYETHLIRKQTELSSSVWKFSACEGEFAGKSYQVAVPSCWENYPDFAVYRGEGVYTRSFTAGGNVRLEFKGVSHTAIISVDGKEVATHYNAYTIFDVVLLNLSYGTHTLEVKADNRFSEASSLHLPNDYQSYGGISRPVVLEQLGAAYIKWVHISPYQENGAWYCKLKACVKNISETKFSGYLKSIINNKEHTSGTVLLQSGEETLIESIVTAGNVSEWMPETPNLYLVDTKLYNSDETVIDDLIERIGFREVKIEGNKIYFNGKALRIKGLCRHEDHPEYGCAIPFSAIQYDLRVAQHLGANSIRTVHYPNDEIFLDLCDEMGILVWEENHARGIDEDGMRNPNFQQQCEDCIGEMITAHYNHPSIYIWGILNECASETEYGKECYEKQYLQIKELDSSRPRSSASCRIKTDICLGYPEVVSYNIYPKWYHDEPVNEYLDDLYQWVQTTEGEGKPFLITEIGAGAIYGYRTPTKVKWSEEYQAKALEEQISAVFAHEGCSGIYIWQFCDVRISEEWFSNRPRSMNNKGVVDEYRRPKLSYEVVKKLFSVQENYFE